MVTMYSTKPRLSRQFILAVLLLLFTQTLFANVDVTLDRSELRLGETVTLVLETADPNQSLEIDTEVLSKDFYIIDTRNESMRSYINGKLTATVRILYVLEPKVTGVLEIPAFTFGNFTSTPISLTVRDAPAQNSGEPPTVFVEAELSKGKAYVNSQLVLTVRLFYRYNLSEASLLEPQIEHTTVIKLGESPMNANRNGVTYRALERNYAIFPERSGELVIPELTFLGRVNEPSARRSGSLFSPLNRGRRVRAASEPLRVMVEPRPAEFPTAAEWLPARQLILKSELRIPDSGARVGEPVTRIIEMLTVGLHDSMLPDISWPALSGARVYPDTPETVARTAGQWVSSRKTSSFAIVPETAGELLLPEIRIPWWDTIEEKLKYAIVPAEKISVLPALAGTVAETNPQPVSAPPPVAAATSSEPASGLVASNNQEAGFWRVLAIIGFALWLFTLFLMLVLRKNFRKPAKIVQQQPNKNSALMQLQQACKLAQKDKAVNSLRKFSRDEPGLSAGLSGLAKRCMEDGFTELATAIETMNQGLYSGQSDLSGDWDGADFLQKFNNWLEQYKGQLRQSSSNQELPPFYPE